MTKIKIDIDSSEKITNASVNITYADGKEESRDVVVTSSTEEPKNEKLIKETDKKIITKSGVNEAFMRKY